MVDGPSSSFSQSILKTGSFSGFHTLGQLGSGYLTAESHRGAPLCGNKEGWGPISQHRYDFTPCFLDVWVSSVAAFGIFAGALAIWWLVRRKQEAQVAKDWHFWLKQVSTPGQLQRRWLMRCLGHNRGHCNLNPFPGRHTDRQILWCMGRRLPVLEQRSNVPVSGIHIHGSMVGTFEIAESEWGGFILLAVHPHRLFGKAAVPDLSAGIRPTQAVLHSLLRRFRAVVDRVRAGMVSSEGEGRVQCTGRRRGVSNRICHSLLDPDVQLDDSNDAIW